MRVELESTVAPCGNAPVNTRFALVVVPNAAAFAVKAAWVARQQGQGKRADRPPCHNICREHCCAVPEDSVGNSSQIGVYHARLHINIDSHSQKY